MVPIRRFRASWLSCAPVLVCVWYLSFHVTLVHALMCRKTARSEGIHLNSDLSILAGDIVTFRVRRVPSPHPPPPITQTPASNSNQGLTFRPDFHPFCHSAAAQSPSPDGYMSFMPVDVVPPPPLAQTGPVIANDGSGRGTEGDAHSQSDHLVDCTPLAISVVKNVSEAAQVRSAISYVHARISSPAHALL